MNKCKNCQEITPNPLFCSRSCSTSFHNKAENGRRIGRKPQIKTCPTCGELFSSRNSRCENCSYGIRNLTKGESLTDDTQKYRKIRSHARVVAKKNKLLDRCAICGYCLHVECAHKKPIQEFPDETPIAGINNPCNLIGLCPNHHWEFDHGQLLLT